VTKIERIKLEEIKQIGLQYIFMWKCHKETPCVAISKMLLFSFLLYKNQRIGGQTRSCLRGWYQWGGEGVKERA
jgi:hypothetical protein